MIPFEVARKNFQNVRTSTEFRSVMEETHKNQTDGQEKRDLPAVELSNAGFAGDLPKLLLASSSPRRSQILQMVGWPFEVGAVEVDESLRDRESAREYVARLAQAKARASAEVHAHRPLLAADTTVVVDEHILAKPIDVEDGKRMLRLLQGRWHQVLTGVALLTETTSEVDVEMTEVRFAPMSEAEIDWYVATGEPMDKAGAYAIQGRGSRYIEGINGDYFNVMGLPVRMVYDLIRNQL
jgi:nucleoside triphosphate pyrophosphatase